MGCPGESSWRIACLENRVFCLRLSEFPTGYRAFRHHVLETVNFAMNSDGFVFDQEILAQIVVARFRIAEVPVQAAHGGSQPPPARAVPAWAGPGRLRSRLARAARRRRAAVGALDRAPEG